MRKCHVMLLLPAAGLYLVATCRARSFLGCSPPARRMMGHSTRDGARRALEGDEAYVTRPRRTAAHHSLSRTKTANAKRALGENAEAAIGGGGGRSQRLAARISVPGDFTRSHQLTPATAGEGRREAEAATAEPCPAHLRTTTASFWIFKLDYSETKNLAIGQRVSSESFSAGGHLWKISCYPRGDRREHNGEYVSILVSLVSKSQNVKAIFDAFLLNRDGTACWAPAKRIVHVFQQEILFGWSRFIKGSDVELNYLANGLARFICGVIVIQENPTPISMPPPDIGNHLGRLLDCAIGSDVSFTVDGEQFPAHRAVLAARSPVFEAELFGSMAEATMPSITVQDIEPAAFKVMLRFIYTDSFPADSELGDSPAEMLQHLLAAADRFALDRLKLICSLKLVENISVDTVGSILVCAETYNCPELKNRCLDFFAEGKNFKEAAFTDGFVILLQKFPSLAAELRKRVVI
ncbi:hypothetical protein C2845_PM13G23040 [Panicum miliaceum]|uniref:BTB/POZ and MATH domain-containing protein 1-like n=1 Tax=Panicum miliaceum TaxID=4540 RepID=A0A3L6RF25_PANMI|nr:hypothetical protein C2845_PM13G23040 [Panicum miliaceum]